ncbi:MAG: GNAT family N-acetyltransferase [Clostridia bacterium]|nr:GNAT family N-acetyltransferase [Clostridia bacterium]
MLHIRKYEEKDFDNVRYVCLNSDGGGMEEKLCKCILHTFCDYYIEKEPENCFVLDDDGKAVGYIICTQNYDSYKEVFDREYLPLNKHLGDVLYNWAKDSTILQNKYKADYPAHLHIDLLPAYQRQGWGGKLISALSEHLRSKGIKGVMLTAGTENVNAGNFYKKYGFEQLEILNTDVAFGMKLIK